MVPVPVKAFAALVAAALAALVAIAALGSGIGVPKLPEPLAILDQRLPGIFRLHMMAAGLGLLLLPWIVLLRHRRSPHRLLGRVGAVLLLTGAAAALPAALQSAAVPLARAGFFAQGVLCLGFLIQAVRAIRAGDVQRHAQLMAGASALVFGAVLLRVMMAIAASLGLPFDASYAALAWGSWGLPLIGVALWSRCRGIPKAACRSQRCRAGITAWADLAWDVGARDAAPSSAVSSDRSFCRRRWRAVDQRLPATPAVRSAVCAGIRAVGLRVPRASTSSSGPGTCGRRGETPAGSCLPSTTR